jgi:hypothetical protein
MAYIQRSFAFWAVMGNSRQSLQLHVVFGAVSFELSVDNVNRMKRLVGATLKQLVEGKVFVQIREGLTALLRPNDQIRVIVAPLTSQLDAFHFATLSPIKTVIVGIRTCPLATMNKYHEPA